MKESKHIPILNTLRAIAALSVCFHHHLFTTKIHIHEYSPMRIFEYGNHGVTLFFVISGFVIPYSMYNKGFKLHNYGKFIIKRLARLEPPYIVAIFLGIAFSYVRVLNPNGNGVDITPNFQQIMLHFGYMIPLKDIFRYFGYYPEILQNKGWIIGVFWSLAIEFQYYLYIGLFFPLVAHKKILYRCVGYAIIFITAISTFLRFNTNFLPSWLPVFMVGIILFLRHVKHIKDIEFYCLLILSLIASYYCRGYEITIATFISFLLIISFTNYENKILHFFSLISYSLYLTHTIVGDPFLNFTSHYIPNYLEEILLFPIAVGLSTGVAYVLYLLVEKPSMKLSSRISWSKKKESKQKDS
ncbi:acyltransferase family protein [Bernardetia sp.]|uniref:acyltransferase family protein n=1 Tax=Bernardetia sp. TaxID=1937974 RepID=UPI0025C05BB3|nr:acyltransferase [Bernardetia sp.]